ncbi:TetR/AcrR family transcriptional regulator [Nocardia cyriacigeorgica]|uniref:TetR/AcrR family transcriptional regulator n=1 Tax=Nocardia cyriacigeorgica TaxID=135487 RepID=UPI000CEA6C7B|nr:TetR/AcrR family transcriptional regulator [Nocardia cyriacigeorgica]AVH23729.1 TetR family transcriptional regulator [Nocardia cyriacigeorgica]MBF6324011.1 helix-turn-helix transcriptional regulator [Nocardia cyriacigeorgica]MBF6496865.1 helix-turn-helix transcriptional regulator [Nocardia cyriacigeorgica]PPJ15042.1 TetR family transcriptional regulator [Nocardia cyriacigeorgica]
MTGKTTGVRAAKATANRAKMLAAARELFTTRGYTPTTMKAIAEQAGMAVQTLYFTFATKRAILSELLDIEIAGDTEPVATMDRPWFAAAVAAAPHEQIRQQVAAAATIYARVSPLLEVIRSAAATDPELAELWQTNIAQRHLVQLRLAEALAAKTPLRGGITAAHAADIALAVLAPETYRLLVHERGWTDAEWESWATDALTLQLLPPEGPPTDSIDTHAPEDAR